jgi:hypothetical protein
LREAFMEKSPIDSKTGGKAKKYPLSGRVLIALIIDSQKPDLTRFSKERETLIQEMMVRKSQDLFQNWARNRFTKSKIDPNPAILQPNE